MPRRRASSTIRGRVTYHNANARIAPRYLDFDDEWLRRISERQYAQFIDLTDIEDRRRWHPSRMLPGGAAPLGFQTRPRVVIVPEGHPLSRFAPYGGRVPLSKALKREARIRRRSLDELSETAVRDVHGGLYRAYIGSHLSRRVGFQHPWQVMICVRRKQRREVIHALGHAGSGRKSQRAPKRNFWSEVHC